MCLVAQSCPTLCDPWTVACQAPLPMGFSRQEYRSGLPCPPPRDLHNPGTEPRSPILQADSLPSEPPGKPMNTKVGSPSLPQGTFPTQESNRGLPCCRRILYQQSYQGIPLKNYSLVLATCYCLAQVPRWGVSVSLWSLKATWLSKMYDKVEVPRSSLANL